MENLYKKTKNWFEKEDVEQLKEFEKLFDENSEDEEIKSYLEDNNIFICSECGDLTHISSMYYYYNDPICENCYYNDFETCGECGDVIRREDSVYCEDNGCVYCETCADENLTFCECCNKYVLNEDIRHVHFNDCNGEYEEICRYCLENRDVSYCDGCGCYVWEAHYVEEDDVCLCDSCFSEHEEETGGNFIESYGYKPSPIFYATPEEEGKKQSISYFGIELEIDRKENNATKREMLTQINEILGDFAYFKRDGSLSSDGIEIVTHPASLKCWKKQKEDLEKVFEICVKSGYRSHNTSCCGLHIHANRKYLSQDREEQDEIINRIILILETFKSQVKKFSRRNNYEYCYFLSDKVYGITEDKNEYIKKIENIKKEKRKIWKICHFKC